jgi:hypothetical protein
MVLLEVAYYLMKLAIAKLHEPILLSMSSLFLI